MLENFMKTTKEISEIMAKSSAEFIEKNRSISSPQVIQEFVDFTKSGN
jgi:hypothetical protein